MFKGMSTLFYATLLSVCALASQERSAAAQGVEQHKGSPEVIVQLGRPNVWTMDQAHYLLERNRALDLQIKQVALGDLDPNAVNGTRLTQTTSSLGVAAAFDQPTGIKNGIALRNYRGDRARYEALLTAQTEALDESHKAAAEKTAAVKRLDQLTADGASPQALNAAKVRVELADLRAQTAQTNYDNLSKAVSEPTVPTLSGTDPSLGTLPAVDSSAAFYKAAADQSKNNSSKLAASQLLDNHINLQYEMVAKQLTLLRDQAGPDNMVLFLELPQSVYLTNKFRPYPYLGGLWGAHVAQSWWRMDAALVVERPASEPNPLDVEAKCRGCRKGQNIRTSKDDLRAPTRRELELLASGPQFFNGGKTECTDTSIDLAAFFHPSSKCAKNYSMLHDKNKKIAVSLSEPVEKAKQDLIDALKAQVEAQSSELLVQQHTGSDEQKLTRAEPQSKAAEQTVEESERKLKVAENDAVKFKTSRKLEELPSKNIDVEGIIYQDLQKLLANYPFPFTLNEKSALLQLDPNCSKLLKQHRNLCVYMQTWGFATTLSATEDNRPNTADGNNLAGVEVQELSSPAQPLPMYTLDLIPRQSALNVADSNSTTSNLSLSALFKFISGFGVQSKYERQRNEYSQFLQQETYASAFGKGSYEFGWTFGPLPGTNRLAPGLRTTYAVVVVPKATRVLRLYGVGCGYRRRDVPRDPFHQLEWRETDFHPRNISHHEECSELSTFDIEVPDGNDNLHVETTYYTPVAAGRRAMVEINGTFDEQVGVLVNGTPLTKVASITQPTLVPTTFGVNNDAAGESNVKGVYEVVSRDQLLATFVLPADSPSTPSITLVTAGKSLSVTELTRRPPSFPPVAPAIVFNKPLTIADVHIKQKKDGDPNSDIILRLIGSGFKRGSSLKVIVGEKSLYRNDPSDTKDSFFVQNDNVATVVVTREVFFPAVSVELIRDEEDGSASPATWKVEDIFPPAVTCEVKEKKNKSLTVTVSGQYFSSRYTPELTGVSGLIVKTLGDPSTGWVITGVNDAWNKQLKLKGPNPITIPCNKEKRT